MARIKYYNKDTNSWEYADSAFSCDNSSGESSEKQVHILNPTWIPGSYVSHDTGTKISNELYSVTEYIDVSKYSAVNVLTKVAGSAGVCLFNSEKKYIDGSQPPNELTTIDVSGASYLRVSCWTATFPNPVIEAVVESGKLKLDMTLTHAGTAADAKAVGDAFNQLLSKEKDIYDSSLNMDRQYYDSEGVLNTDLPGWYTTADMDISEAQSVKYGGLNKTASANVPRSVFKNASGAVIHVFKPTTGDNTLEIPVNAVYVAFTLHSNDTTSFYAKAVFDGDLAYNIMTGWYRVLGDRMKNLLSKATQKKICCIVDDDTVNVASVQLLKDACDANNIKATMACLTTNIERESNAGLTEKLLEMEQNGFQVVLHAHTQTGYKNDPDHEDDIWLDPETNTAKCESDLVQGLQKMEAVGFTDYKYWVTPYCKDGEAVQRMARKWGMKCLLAGGNKYEPADDTNGRYAIRRVAFGNDYTVEENGETVVKENSSLSFESLKIIAQEAAENNGWLVIMTHFSEWAKPNSQKGADGDYSKFNNLINYLKNDLKYEFMTVGEAWSYRKAIYDVYDMF